MKTRILIPLLTSFAAAAVYAAATQEAYLLRLNLQPNTSEKYKIDLASNQHIDFPGVPPDINVKGAMDFEFKTTAVDKGIAEVEMKTTNMKIDAGELGSMMGMDKLPPEIMTKAKMDDRFRVTESTTAGLSAQAQMAMSMSGSSSNAMFFELPEKAIKLGDSWQVTLPKNPMLGPKEHPLTATLVSLKDYDGAPVYEVSIRGKFDYDVDVTEAMKSMNPAGGAAGGGGLDPSSLNMKIHGNMNVAGSTLLSRTTGMVQFSTVKLDSKQIMNVMGTDVNINGTTTVNMKIAK